VQFGVASCYLGQIPTSGRGRSAHPVTAIQHPTPFQDPPQGPHAGEGVQALLVQRPVDGHGTKLTQVTPLQLLTQTQHAFLQSPWRTASGMSDRRLVGPFHPIQSSPAGTPNPAMHCGQAHAEAPSHLAERTSATDGTDQSPSSFGQGVFDSCMTSENQFSITIPRPSNSRPSVPEAMSQRRPDSATQSVPQAVSPGLSDVRDGPIIHTKPALRAPKGPFAGSGAARGGVQGLPAAFTLRPDSPGESGVE